MRVPLPRESCGFAVSGIQLRLFKFASVRSRRKNREMGDGKLPAFLGLLFMPMYMLHTCDFREFCRAPLVGDAVRRPILLVRN